MDEDRLLSASPPPPPQLQGSAEEEDERSSISTQRQSFTSCIDEFCDFLTVAIHTITYERELYPSNLFIQARKYNHPVKQARHPKLCSWIQDAVEACRKELLKCAVEKICVIIVSPSNQAIERFVFDISSFPVIPLEAINTPLFHSGGDGLEGGGGGGGRADAAAMSQKALDVEEQYRAGIMKLGLCSPRLGKLPPGCTFSVSIELKEDYPPEENGDISSSWICMEKKGKQTQDGKGTPNSNVKTIPIRKISADVFPLELWIEKNETSSDKEKT